MATRPWTRRVLPNSCTASTHSHRCTLALVPSLNWCRYGSLRFPVRMLCLSSVVCARWWCYEQWLPSVERAVSPPYACDGVVCVPQATLPDWLSASSCRWLTAALTRNGGVMSVASIVMRSVKAQKDMPAAAQIVADLITRPPPPHIMDVDTYVRGALHSWFAFSLTRAMSWPCHSFFFAHLWVSGSFRRPHRKCWIFCGSAAMPHRLCVAPLWVGV